MTKLWFNTPRNYVHVRAEPTQHQRGPHSGATEGTERRMLRPSHVATAGTVRRETRRTLEFKAGVRILSDAIPQASRRYA